VIQTGCGTSPLTSLFYAKFNINNQDMCLPVICEDCSEYQACES
jgi:hypothetical protein